MAKRKLDLNSISRYSKISPQFVLEEHSHCEVPAGCGGVVLRWINPDRAIPIEFWLYAECEHNIALDGKTLTSSRPMVEHNAHALAFRFKDFNVKNGIFMFHCSGETEKHRVGASGPASTHSIKILSAPDDTWKYTMIQPVDESWALAGFDDSNWKNLVSKPVSKPKKDSSEAYRYNKLIESGAEGLGINEKTVSSGTIWVRKEFKV